jgi:hypothetical protein
MTSITITGAGGVINNEVEIIVHALRDAGYTVTVDNPYADAPLDPNPVAAYEALLKHTRTFAARYPECGPLNVRVKADHIPWGG